MVHKNIPKDRYDEIMSRLKQIEIDHNVKVIYAIESGSRAWGFHSPDSDFDVRFIYVRPKEWYLSTALELQKDVIEQPIVDDMDCNGWDIRKALQLLTKTNPGIIEWLHSPIQYINDGLFRELCKEYLEEHFDKRSSLYHYRSSALQNFNQFIFNKDTVNLKKYLYVLRPIFATMWLNKFNTIPPIEFDKLRVIDVDPEVNRAIDDLLVLKASGSEMLNGQNNPHLYHFVEVQLDWMKDMIKDHSSEQFRVLSDENLIKIAAVDKIFLTVLDNYNGLFNA